jgi:hypothetical protein
MRKSISVSFVLAIFVSMTLQANASVNLSFNSKGLTAIVNLNHYKWEGDKEATTGQYTLDASMSSNRHKAQGTSLGVYPGSLSGNTVEVFLYLNSDSRGKPQDTTRMSESLGIRLYGRYYNLSTSTGFFDNNDGGGKGAAPIDLKDNAVPPVIVPDYWSVAYGSFRFDDTGVTSVWGNSDLDARIYNDYYTGLPIDQVNLWSSLYVQFDTVKGAQEFYDGVAMIASPVPEPTSLAFASIIGTGLMVRRRR